MASTNVVLAAHDISIDSVQVNNHSTTTTNVVNTHIHYNGDRRSPCDMDPRRQRLYKNIAPGALYNSLDRTDAPKCHPETRVAVQQELLSWLAHPATDADPGRIKWLTGPAGTGKTAIMGSIAETCQRNGQLAAAFFFSSFGADARRRSKKYLVPTLAYQLVQHDAFRCVGERILDAVANNPAIFETRLRDQVEQLILRPLKECAAVDDRMGREVPPPLALLVDGLDECQGRLGDIGNVAGLDVPYVAAPLRTKEAEQVDILDALLYATADPRFPFRIIIASRPERNIRDFFSAPHVKAVVSELFLDERYYPDDDIRLFLHSRFSEVRRRFPDLPVSWPGGDVVSLLVDRSSGQFIYAATIMRFVDSPPNPPHVQLEKVLKLQTAPGSNPFAPLDALYAFVMGSSPDPHMAVKWIGVSRVLSPGRSYSSEERWGWDKVNERWADAVRYYLESFQGETEYLFASLASLVCVTPIRHGHITSREALLSVYHKSIFDFLEDPDRSGDLYLGKAEEDAFMSRLWVRSLMRLGEPGYGSSAVRLTTALAPSCMFDDSEGDQAGLKSCLGDLESCDPSSWLKSILAIDQGTGSCRMFCQVMFTRVHFSQRSEVAVDRRPPDLIITSKSWHDKQHRTLSTPISILHLTTISRYIYIGPDAMEVIKSDVMEHVVNAVEGGAPFLSLPTELILEVLRTAISECDLSPFTLGTICSLLRKIALSNPILWTSIRYRGVPRRLDSFDVWVRRAQEMPLSIRIQPPNRPRANPSPKKAALRNLATRIIAKSSKISSLELTLPPDFFEDWASREPTPHFPILSRLHINPGVHTLHRTPKLDFEKALMLRSVRISDLYILYVRVPWSSIVDLRLDNPTVSEIQDALSSASSVEGLYVQSVIDHDFDTDKPDEPISNASLRHLTVAGMDRCPRDNACKMLGSLHLPGLETLVFTVNSGEWGPFGVDPQPWVDIYPFIRKWGCPLRELTLGRGVVHEETFVKCLGLLPSLRHLGIIDVAWARSSPGVGPPSGSSHTGLYKRLAEQAGVLLPKLESLMVEYGGESVGPETRESILGLLESRGMMRTAVFKGVFVDEPTDRQCRVKREWQGTGREVVLN